MIQRMARQALRNRSLLRLPFEGGALSRLRTMPVAAQERSEASPLRQEIADRIWRERGGDRFDGQLLGVSAVAIDGGSVTFACEAIRYRDYLAADALLAEPAAAPVTLAVGVHIVLSSRGRVLCLRLADGGLTLPGGAVDHRDFEAERGAAVARALAREIEEETGLILPMDAFEVTGIYVGGHPTHLLVLATAEPAEFDLEAAGEVARAEPDEGLAGVELVPLDELVARMESLPLVLRAGLQSLQHARGRGRFEAIAIHGESPSATAPEAMR